MIYDVCVYKKCYKNKIMKERYTLLVKIFGTNNIQIYSCLFKL